MAVAAAGLELVAQGGLVYEDVHEHGDDDGNDDAAVDLAAGEELVKAHLGGGHAVEAGLVDVVGLGVLDDVFEVADLEGPGDGVGGYPVRHDGGQDLVNIEVGLDEAGDAAPDGAGGRAAEEGEQPDDGGRHHVAGYAEGYHEAGHGAHEVLAGRADVEKAGLEGDGDGETRHDERRGTEKHVARADGVEAEGQRALGAAGGEDAGEDYAHALPRALAGEAVAGVADHEDDDAADQKSDDDGGQAREHRLGGVLGPKAVEAVSHAFSPFPSRLAPAM